MDRENRRIRKHKKKRVPPDPEKIFLVDRSELFPEDVEDDGEYFEDCLEFMTDQQLLQHLGPDKQTDNIIVREYVPGGKVKIEVKVNITEIRPQVEKTGFIDESERKKAEERKGVAG